MADSWSCLAVEKGPGMLDEVILAALKKAACTLSHKGLDAMTFREKVCEGRIETDWKSFDLGSRGGIIFRTEVEAGDASFKVNFLLNRADLDRGEEVIRAFEDGTYRPIANFGRRFPVPELYDFTDLRSARSFH